MPANGSTASFTTAAGTLQANTIYSARIELEDTTGTLKSTNTFWFDTFSDAYVATLKTIEVEDYNYSNGVYQLDPIPVSGMDTNGAGVNGNVVVGGNNTGYYGFIGTPGIDYLQTGRQLLAVFSEYRPDDRVQITQGSYTTASRTEGGDVVDYASNVATRARSQHTARKISGRQSLGIPGQADFARGLDELQPQFHGRKLSRLSALQLFRLHHRLSRSSDQRPHHRQSDDSAAWRV